MEDTSWMKKKFIRWMEDHRGLILTVFGLPLSFIFDLVMQVFKVVVNMQKLTKTHNVPVPELVLPCVPLQPC